MKIAIAIIIIGLLFTKRLWQPKLVALLMRYRSGKGKTGTQRAVEKINKDVFSPQGTIRTFVIPIQITELGNGEVTIAVIKGK